jgi:hypothetical protein
MTFLLKRIGYQGLAGLLCLIIGLPVVFLFQGTGDAGDSIHHYQYARYAWENPENLFNHWAKPLYVLLASPFAQFGFQGIKLFNLICSSVAVYFTIRTARNLHLPSPWLPGLLLMAAPLNMALTFSGLTEPLFAAVLSAGICLFTSNKYAGVALLLSFLPFVRSEGLIICATAAVYLLLKKQYRSIPLLAAGHVIYSLAGAAIHGDVLWVFTKIPYAKASSTYGNGDLFHFANQLVYVSGLPFLVLFLVGLVGLAVGWRHFQQHGSEWLLLIVGGFAAFFVAHSLFWYLGIFNSMGLNRVLVSVLPLMALVAAAVPKLLLTLQWRKTPVTVVAVLFVAYLIAFPFTGNHASLHRYQLQPQPELVMAKRVLKSLPEPVPAPVLSNAPYFTYLLERNPFDLQEHILLSSESLALAPAGSIVCWDNWFSTVEGGIPEQSLLNDPRLELIARADTVARDRPISVAVFRVRK